MVPATSSRLRVFLCHSSSDKSNVLKLYEILDHEGWIDVWLDNKKLLPGSEWEFEIDQAVRQSHVVIVCLSNLFNQAGFRQKEVKWALDAAMEQPEGEIFIIPARFEECETPRSLKKWHWVNLYEESGYEKLLKALKARAEKLNLAFYPSNKDIPARQGNILEDRYKVLKILSVTPYSQVVRAWDRKLDRQVAIRLYSVQEGIRDAEWLRLRVERDAVALMGLVHPNVASIYEVINRPFGIVSEWIDGSSLFDLLSEMRSFNSSELIQFGIEITNGLDYLHGIGVIHRNIKPSNIIFNSLHQPKLIDFDVAALPHSQTIVSRDDLFYYTGSKPYCAPECYFDGKKATPKSDVFSLAIVLYEMFTLEYPSLKEEKDFRMKLEQNGMPNELSELLYDMLNMNFEMRPPSSTVLRKLQSISDNI